MKWEYKTLNYSKRSFLGFNINIEALNEQLNKLGNEGWELVNMLPGQTSGGLGVVVILNRQRG